MFELLDSINHWHWLAFGLALLAIELLGTAGYFLWLGLSALIVGILLTFIPMSWQLQWSAFSIFSLMTTWLWWRKQFKQDASDDQQRDLNQKQKQMIGQKILIESDLTPGKHRIKVGDTTWSAQTNQSIPAGTMVEITQVNGIVLTIEAKN
ncbi:NfeD family protein [Vibrio sp. Isolate25]|uniref:NfeD family protein n=1 Tax=Vibrio TaxID=662 RepID=UPI001EFDC2BD|nr:MULTISPECIES: NfeD family protein [Vibrio]MCG9598301.1 NfeD family protein [Vibrio sp. Isolate25]MCG9679472.1 NfeD family protein [Vibrio sp. Isolate24]USD33203.1 NfeD family protein [Vibrio sp. SCSIO 43186]USD46272.1 NfeD family protein [Vibrio sp. SCSIO 43145]USD70327.1 NfeD family protein [Vibrio sp. SCSIO 43139]